MKNIETLHSFITKNSDAIFDNLKKEQCEAKKKIQEISKLIEENNDVFPQKLIMDYQNILRCFNDICVDTNKLDKLYQEFKKGYMDVITSQFAYHEAYYG